MLVLGIDTSGKNASVAVCSQEQLLAQYFLKTDKTHPQVILPLCRKMLDDLDISIKDIDRFAVSAGPGSYTGLRIGISAVKAMAFGLGKECNGISTLEALAYNFAGIDSYVCCVMKARLDIVYCAIFKINGDTVSRCTDDQMISKSELADKLEEFTEQIIITGDGAENFVSEFKNEHFLLSSFHLRYQLASGICMSALNKDGQDPDEINAFYMQVTKAEKDLLEKK